MGTRVTIKDIAKEAGMSVTAVSQVLNNRPIRISDEKRELIKQIAAQKHYAPNEIARSLVTRQAQKSQTLGLIVPNLENQHYAQLAMEIEDICRFYGYSVFIASCHNRTQDYLRLLNVFIHRGVDGLFLVPMSSMRNDSELMRELTAMDLPTVQVSYALDELPHDYIRVDEEKGAYDAVMHLIKLGHAKIGCLVNSYDDKHSEGVVKGYMDAHEHKKLELNARFVQGSTDDFPSAKRAALRMIETGVSAVYASSEILTLALLAVMGEKHLRVGEDISIIGCDLGSLADLLSPAITSVESTTKPLAKHSFEMLRRRIDQLTSPRMIETVVPELCKRQSVAKIK